MSKGVKLYAEQIDILALGNMSRVQSACGAI